MTDHHAPIPRQLWIKSRCIAVETQFGGRIGRASFAARFLPLLLLLSFAYLNGLRPEPFLPSWVSGPVVAVAAYLSLLVLSHRFHDLGQSGANLLQIVLPIFVWLWVGDDLMAKVEPKFWISAAAVLAVWPVVVLLRLFFSIPPRGSAPNNA